MDFNTTTRLLTASIRVLAATAILAAATCEMARADDGACRAARQRLDALFNELAQGCESDAQCEAVYLRPHACDGPVVLRAGRSAQAEKTILTLQRDVRAACKEQYTNLPACAPRAAAPRCRARTCTDILER